VYVSRYRFRIGFVAVAALGKDNEMLESLRGQTAIITGAGAGPGMGREIPLAFARAGANLVLNYLLDTVDEMESFADSLRILGSDVALVRGDISNEATSLALVERALQRDGKIDVLVNNAGISTPAPVVDITLEQWDRMMGVNLTGVFLPTRAVLPSMCAAGFGRVISIASQVGQKGSEEHAHYAATKAGVIGFTKSVAREVGRFGVTVNCVAPGPIQTRLMGEVSEEWRQGKLAELVIPRFGTPEEVVPSVLFLASSPGGNLYTGQTLGPNSGDVML
jgi:3-oxoacyl-[acyl-carrier protein] reductase